MLATGFVVYQSNSIVDNLRARAAELLSKAPPADDAQCVYNRYMAATLYKDTLDIVEHDPGTANMLLGQAVSAMLTYIFHERGLFIPRSKDLLNRVSEIDAHLGEAANRFFAAGSLPNRLIWAEKIADYTIQTHGFFEWESAPEELSV